MKQVIISAKKEKGVDNDNMGFLKYLFDRKVFDETIDSYNAEKIKDWLAMAKELTVLSISTTLQAPNFMPIKYT